MSTEPVPVYHYESRNKFYRGCEPARLCPQTGVPLLPAFATFVRPPLLETSGAMIACFDEVTEQWHVEENDFWRPKSNEINYDAGRNSTTYKPISLSIYKDFPLYPSISMICSGPLVTTYISKRFQHIHKKFESICLLYKLTKASVIPPPQPWEVGDVFVPNMVYKLEVEALVFHMRRMLDTLTQLTYLITNAEEVQKNHKITCDGIGRVAELKSANTDFERILIGDANEYQRDETGFLYVINGLFNSFKHCLMHEESYALMGLDAPTIVSYYAKSNNYNNEIEYHNHHAFHIMMGFQDSVLRIIRNQKLYQLHRNT
jgi:hypothetical protein